MINIYIIYGIVIINDKKIEMTHSIDLNDEEMHENSKNK